MKDKREVNSTESDIFEKYRLKWEEIFREVTKSQNGPLTPEEKIKRDDAVRAYLIEKRKWSPTMMHRSRMKIGAVAIQRCKDMGQPPTGLRLMRTLREVIAAVPTAELLIKKLEYPPEHALMRAVIARKITPYNPFGPYDPTPSAPTQKQGF